MIEYRHLFTCIYCKQRVRGKHFYSCWFPAMEGICIKCKKIIEKKQRDVSIIKKRIFVQEAKDRPCMDCGNNYPKICMDFDHLQNKKFNISWAVNKGVGFFRLKKEIEKCEVVCSNCHRIRTHNRANNSKEVQVLKH